ncbi:MAG: DUF4411 family protein [Bacteroidetes bacterium]|nr:DUF4411 family protein [Bacteroidota bacterium]
MSEKEEIYCLDTNILIQPWTTYYSPEFCPDFWEILKQLGNQNRIFICTEVYDEIKKTEDDLYKWLKDSKIPVKKTSEAVINCLKDINSNPIHLKLADNTKSRSLADPWVIAHAMNQKAVVVTKEEKITAENSPKIKIPNVCDNMKVRWINDFGFIKEVGIKFSCQIV